MELQATIRSLLPEHSILGEETGFKAGSEGSEYLWVVDPIDGTTAFVTGKVLELKWGYCKVVETSLFYVIIFVHLRNELRTFLFKVVPC